MTDAEKDTGVLANLLKEYTTALRAAITQRQSVDSAGLLATVISAALLGLGMLALLPGKLVSSWTGPAAATIACVMVIAATTITVFLRTFGKRRRILNDEIDVIAHKLDKIVRRASQQMEHEQTTFGAKLELDLWLTEAEAALQRTSGTRKTLSSSRKAFEVIESTSARMQDFLASQRLNTDKWYFSGGTGRYTRMITLPELSGIAKNESRHITVKLQVINPNNDAACRGYARYRGGLKSASTDAHKWTARFVRLQCIATIVSLVRHKVTNSFLRNISISLKDSYSPIRLDVTAASAILTTEEKDAPVLIYNRGSYLYKMYEDEFLQTFEQGDRLDCEQGFVIRSDQITIEDVKDIAARLKIDAGLLEEDYKSICDNLKERRNPYEP